MSEPIEDLKIYDVEKGEVKQVLVNDGEAKIEIDDVPVDEFDKNDLIHALNTITRYSKKISFGELGKKEPREEEEGVKYLKNPHSKRAKILKHVFLHGTATSGDIGEALNIDTSTKSSALSMLERYGLLETVGRDEYKKGQWRKIRATTEAGNENALDLFGDELSEKNKKNAIKERKTNKEVI